MLTFKLEFEKKQDLESFREKKQKDSGEVRERFKQKGDCFEAEKELVWCEISLLSVRLQPILAKASYRFFSENM